MIEIRQHVGNFIFLRVELIVHNDAQQVSTMVQSYLKHGPTQASHIQVYPLQILIFYPGFWDNLQLFFEFGVRRKVCLCTSVGRCPGVEYQKRADGESQYHHTCNII